MDSSYTSCIGLSDVLALLDAVDGGKSFLDDAGPDTIGSDASSNFSSDDSAEAPARISEQSIYRPQQQQQQQQAKPDKRKRASRKEKNIPYSTVLQRRKKEELRLLKKEADELSEELDLLKASRRGPPAPASSALQCPENPYLLSRWRHTATVEHEKRQRSERTNRELRAIMENQLKVHGSVRKLLGKKTTLEGWNYVFHSDPRVDQPLKTVDFSNAVLADLSTAVERLRLQTDSVFQAHSGLSTVSCSLENKYHAGIGDYVEVSSVTTVACPFEKAAKVLWHHNTTKTSTDADKSFRFKRMRNADTLERNCLATLRDGMSGVLHLDGVNMVRRFEGSHRTTMVGTTTWFLPTDGLRFDDDLWTLVSRSPSDPENSCVVQSCYRLRATAIEAALTCPGDLAHVRELVLRSIGKKLRDVTQLQQNVLLEKVAVFTSTRTPAMA